MKVRRPFTKFVIDARKTMGLTQEEAAELLGISTSTLQHYESDDARIHDDIASRMAMVYHDPRIAKMYCGNECALGCENGHCDFEKSQAEIMLDLLLMNPEELPQVVRTLHRITADGVIDETEKDDCDSSLEYLARLAKNVEALMLQIQRVDSRSQR